MLMLKLFKKNMHLNHRKKMFNIFSKRNLKINTDLLSPFNFKVTIFISLRLGCINKAAKANT